MSHSHSRVDMQPSALVSLPEEIQLEIYLQLGLYDMGALLRTSGYFQRFATAFWRAKRQQFGSSRAFFPHPLCIYWDDAGRLKPIFEIKPSDPESIPHGELMAMSEEQRKALQWKMPEEVVKFAVCVVEGAIERLSNNEIPRDWNLIMSFMDRRGWVGGNFDFSLLNVMLECDNQRMLDFIFQQVIVPNFGCKALTRIRSQLAWKTIFRQPWTEKELKDFDTVDAVDASPIHWAAARGDSALIQAYLSNPKYWYMVPCQDFQKKLPLHYAARTNQVAIVEMLLTFYFEQPRLCVDTNIILFAHHIHSMFMNAVDEGRIKLVKTIYEHPVLNLIVHAHFMEHAIDKIIRCNVKGSEFASLVKYVLERISAIDIDKLNNLLDKAVIQDNLEAVGILLQHESANVSCQMLFNAAKQSLYLTSFRVLDTLLAHKTCQINSLHDGETILTFLFKSTRHSLRSVNLARYHELIYKLLDKGTDPRLMNGEYKSAIAVFDEVFVNLFAHDIVKELRALLLSRAKMLDGKEWENAMRRRAVMPRLQQAPIIKLPKVAPPPILEDVADHPLKVEEAIRAKIEEQRNEIAEIVAVEIVEGNGEAQLAMQLKEVVDRTVADNTEENRTQLIDNALVVQAHSSPAIRKIGIAMMAIGALLFIAGVTAIAVSSVLAATLVLSPFAVLAVIAGTALTVTGIGLFAASGCISNDNLQMTGLLSPRTL